MAGKQVSKYMLLGGGSNKGHRLREFKSQLLRFATLYLSLPVSKIGIIVVPVSLVAVRIKLVELGKAIRKVRSL